MSHKLVSSMSLTARSSSAPRPLPMRTIYCIRIQGGGRVEASGPSNGAFWINGQEQHMTSWIGVKMAKTLLDFFSGARYIFFSHDITCAKWSKWPCSMGSAKHEEFDYMPFYILVSNTHWPQVRLTMKYKYLDIPPVCNVRDRHGLRLTS